MRVLEFCEGRVSPITQKNTCSLVMSRYAAVVAQTHQISACFHQASKMLWLHRTQQWKKLIQTPVVNKPTASKVRIQVSLFPFPGNYCGFPPLSFKDLQHFHSSQPPATATSRTISGLRKRGNPWGLAKFGKRKAGTITRPQGKSKVPTGRHPWKPTRSNEIENTLKSTCFEKG